MSIWKRITGGGKRQEVTGRGDLLRLRARVLNTPHAICPDKLAVIASVLSGSMGVSGLELVPDDVPEQAAQPSGQTAIEPVGASVAIIAVHGTLVQRSGGLDAMSGLTSYGSIRAAFDEALADGNVAAIILDIDSGGGEIAGLFELVDHIAASRAIKPVTAIVNEFAASAAYTIAAAASRVVAPRTAAVGSIGVVAMHVDQSGANAKDGLAVSHIIAGDHKIDGTPHAPLSDDARSSMQSRVNALYDVLVASVARNRGVDEQVIRGTQAQMYMASDALALGLIDEISGVEAAVQAAVARASTPADEPADEPEEPEEPPALPDPEPEDAPAPELPEPEERPGPVATAVAAERARIGEIASICEVFGVPDLARRLNASGTSVDDARVQASRYAALNDPQTFSGVDPMAKSGPQGAALLLSAVKRQNEKRKR